MTRPPWKEIAVRAWEYRPTWKEQAAMSASCVLAWWVFDAPLWAIAVAYVLVCVVTFGMLGWLDLANEHAEAADPDSGGAD